MRRRTRGQIVDGQSVDLAIQYIDGPLFSGSDDENVACGRCDRTLLLGVARENAWTAVRTVMGIPDPHAGTAAAGRPHPVFIECDCGAMNRIWPIVPG